MDQSTFNHGKSGDTNPKGRSRSPLLELYTRSLRNEREEKIGRRTSAACGGRLRLCYTLDEGKESERETTNCPPKRVRSSSINCSTRGNVHRSVAKPSASAPAFNACIRSRRCASSSPEGRPRGRLFSASNPPACNCAFHSDTVVRVTLRRRATSACATPRCSSRPARSRRRCNPFASRSALSMLRLANIAYHVGPHSAKQVASHLCKSL